MYFLASRSSVGSLWFEMTFLGLFTCSLSLSTLSVSLARVSSICLSDWISLWGELVGSFPVMMFSRSDTSSMMGGSAIEWVFVSINIFQVVTLASDILLRRRVLSDVSVSIGWKVWCSAPVIRCGSVRLTKKFILIYLIGPIFGTVFMSEMF